jgi:glycosyltransferase involved in cell wall biosynthesis
MNPLVSIITPTYNHEKYIADCIQSVLDQTFLDWELIVVNDGSSDSTAEIVSGFCRQDSRIRLFNRENVGILRLAETYNFALSQTKGKYVAILEGDDFWVDDKLTRQVESMESNPDLVLAWGVASLVDAGNNKVYYTSPDPRGSDAKYFNNEPVGSILNVLLLRNCIPALTIIIRKDKLVEIGGFKQGYNLPLIDLPTLHELSVEGSFYFDDRLLGSWRIYPDQTTKKYVVGIIRGFRDLAMDNYKRFRSLPGVSHAIDTDQLDKHFKKLIIIAYSRDGRYKLIRKEFKQARRDYLTSIVSPGGECLWKLRSFTGLILSLLHLDVEWLAKLLNRPTYKD